MFLFFVSNMDIRDNRDVNFSLNAGDEILAFFTNRDLKGGGGFDFVILYFDLRVGRPQTS